MAMIVKLNKKQFNYLSENLSEELILELKPKQVNQEKQFVFVEVDDDMVDEINDWAEEELQRKGFDLNYELTPEGELLEDLIDAFYI
jgi:hypothetical protein